MTVKKKIKFIVLNKKLREFFRPVKYEKIPQKKILKKNTGILI